MKTQINTLVQGASHAITGVIGTSREVRKEISEKVISENPEKMTIELNGEVIELTANWSLSRKSVVYSGLIPVEFYKSFVGEFGLPKNNPKAYININSDMRTSLKTNSRKPMFHYIENSNITIK